MIILPSNTFQGRRIIIRKPWAVFRTVVMYKKHRKKRRSTRVKVFSHYEDMLEDGQILVDEINNVMHVNQLTFNRLMEMK